MRGLAFPAVRALVISQGCTPKLLKQPGPRGGGGGRGGTQSTKLGCTGTAFKDINDIRRHRDAERGVRWDSDVTTVPLPANDLPNQSGRQRCVAKRDTVKPLPRPLLVETDRATASILRPYRQSAVRRRYCTTCLDCCYPVSAEERRPQRGSSGGPQHLQLCAESTLMRH